MPPFLVAMVMVAALALGANFTWSGGGGANTSWGTCENWEPPPPNDPCTAGYPDGTNDNATIPWNASGWDIGLISELIGNWVIESSVDFAGVEEPTVFTNGTITIDASSGDVELNISGASVFVP